MDNFLEINLQALADNFKKISDFVGSDTSIMGVVKSNAYGHGLEKCALALDRVGCKWFAVTDIFEAQVLRKILPQSAILILGPVSRDDFSSAISGNFRLTIDSENDLEFLAGKAQIFGKRATIHIKVNTGMNRFGCDPLKVVSLVEKAKNYSSLFVEGIYSHFYNSADHEAIEKQWKIFSEVLFDLQKKDLEIPLRHIANSDAVFLNDQVWLELIRLGLALYGLAEQNVLALAPVLNWKAKILKIRGVSQGECVSYGCDYKAKKDFVLAIIGAGYADGYSRALSGKAEVLVSGKKCKVVGRINMDYTFIDITSAMRVSQKMSPAEGDEVILVGRQDKEEITVNDLARWAGTIPHEIVSRLPESAERRLVDRQIVNRQRLNYLTNDVT
ncbi:MAG: alanine racemase [Candidatus Berkelbacteria bacterium Licking1014_7]|uniref:Alanine racemase n=1 Tax=Candidatus Berkelbacteria bacterium Licking1014_7 TaxID=2017147 RepID=A0A554LJJ6_9BACT|nr:MAG: alanine racemase [Candidatus Berkelbacteria bacterium Licking1014_7]